MSLVLLTSSCGENKNKDKDYFNGEIRHVDGSHRIIKNVSSKLVPLNGGNYGLIAVHDSLLICWNPKLHNYYFNLFNLNTGEEIASFCPKGQGPEDLVDANPIFQILKNKENELSAFLFERERLLKWNISQSIQKNTTVWDTIVPFTNKAGIHRTYNFIFSPSEDTLLAYVRPDYINEYRVFTPYYEKRIISADVRVQDFHIYKKETILNKEISPDMFFYTWDAIKPDGSKIVQVMRTLPQINIIDTHTGEIIGCRLEGGPDFSLVESKKEYTTVYYNWVHTDDRFIYAVYWGKEQWAVGYEDKIPDFHTIHVFDWEGQLRYELQTDRVFFRIWADPVKNRLYTQNHDTDEVYFIDLNELNL